MINLPTPLQELSHPLLDEKQVRLFVKRDDLTHPEIMGNKWRKLKFNLYEAKKQHFKGLITMGGAFSNHIAATAAAAAETGLESIGIIRGNELNEKSNGILQFASKKGMKLEFVDRKYFRMLRNNAGKIADQYENFYFLPEGGTNQLAIKGCGELLDEINIDFDIIVSPVGTGGTLCGLISMLNPHQKALGISSLKGEFIKGEVKKLLLEHKISSPNYEIITHYHFGGYAKKNTHLINFIHWFNENFNIKLDPIYTGKSFFAIWDMIMANIFKRNISIVLIHTGGLINICSL